MIVYTFKMCTGEAGPELQQSLVLLTVDKLLTVWTQLDIRPYLDPNCLTPERIFEEVNFIKKLADNKKARTNYSAEGAQWLWLW